ncbi:hypothetical protein E3N88_24237 [Mikania micrantha]|uniref:Integrase catalytic domain-containing protein n=1 Tax=Mikania micrantha TaxID=192012 RepID=A0A5N6NFG4_9ASTR|nr:hypothetical protein E3N88_24237 [Mikania micrantha]
MKKGIALYVGKCLKCSKVKAKHQKPSGLLQQPKFPQWKWEQISIDFINKLPRTPWGYDSIWVIVDRLTKSAHFLPIREDDKMEKFSTLYVDEIIARPGTPTSMISDHDSRFTSRFWQSLQKAWELVLILAHRIIPKPMVKANGLSKPTMQVFNVRHLKICMVGSADHRSTRTEVGDSQVVGPELIQETTDKISIIQSRLQAARDRQNSYVDRRRKPLEFQNGKLAPRYVGPFEILERIGPVAYKAKLPVESSNVHDTFHVSNLKKCLADHEVQIPLEDIRIQNNMQFVEQPVEIMDHVVKKLKCSRIPVVKVRWEGKCGAEFT